MHGLVTNLLCRPPLALLESLTVLIRVQQDDFSSRGCCTCNGAPPLKTGVAVVTTMCLSMRADLLGADYGSDSVRDCLRTSLED